MTRKSAIHSLLKPSLSSVVVGGTIVTWLALSSLWSVVKNAPFVSDYISYSNSQSTAIAEASSSLGAVTASLLASPLFNQAFYIGMWALVGILCYFILAIILMGTSDMKLALSVSEKSKFSSNGFQNIYSLGLRLLFRVFMGIIFIFGLIMFFQLIMPIASLTIIAGADFDIISSPIYVLSGVLLLACYIHALLIILRLMLLRVRIFNNTDEIILSQ